MQTSPEKGMYIAVIQQQLEDGIAGLAMLQEIAPQATRNLEYLVLVVAGARTRVWSLERLLERLGCNVPRPAIPDDPRPALAAEYERSMSREDAACLIEWSVSALVECED
jgi:hypothetical protein